MKKLLIFLIAVITLSCSVNDDNTPRTYQELLPIESVILPEVFEFGQTYEITLNYIKPTNCHTFNDVYYSKYLNERIVAIISTVYVDNVDCTSIEAEAEASFNFQAIEPGSYIFKFWQGQNEYGDDTYLIFEVPVLE